MSAAPSSIPVIVLEPDTLITTLDDRSTMFISFEIPEAFISDLRIGDKVQLETWSNKKPVGAGEIIDIGSRIDPQNRTFVARARIPNGDDTAAARHEFPGSR